MKVTVITPTFQRHRLLESLYRVFDRQSHHDKELLILDDSPSPSDVIDRLRDPRVRYMHSTNRMTVGAKRDRLVREATGEVIVQFDDDDYYAPTYVEKMIGHLSGYDMVKLSSWFIFDCSSQDLFYWNTRELARFHYVLGKDVRGAAALDMRGLDAQRDDWIVTKLWGYGFSYAFRKAMYTSVQFDSTLNHSEDYGFVQRCLQHGFRLRAIPDDSGLSLNVIHEGHLSRVFPNYRVPPFVFEQLFGAETRLYLRDAHNVR